VIFVTVGTLRQPFSRLLNAVEELASGGFFGDESVFIQTGHNPQFKSQRCECRNFTSIDEFKELMQKASIVISHAGQGTISHSLRGGKMPVIMPRRHKYKEHIDDHQLELASAMAEQRLIIPAYEVQELRSAIQQARALPAFTGWGPQKETFAKIGRAMDQLLANRL
jgi:UDP-N-acetylglucosamine transferase subunit ALG13